VALGPGRAGAAEVPRPALEAARAVQAFEDAAERLQRARAALAALDARETPRGAAADWEGVEAAMEAAAEALKRAELPPVPDTSDLAVSQEQLRSCATRGTAVARAERGARAIQAEAQRFAEARAWLRERQAVAQGAEEARRALQKASARVQDDGRLARWFTWSWPGLERPLASAIAGYQGDLRRWQERLERGQAELRGRANNLAGLAGDYARSRDCVLAGRWVGVRTLEGAVSPVALKLAPAGNGWGGSVTVNGAEEPVRGVTVRGNTIQVTVGERRSALRLTLAADERTMKGTMSAPDGLAPLTLKKQ
jgi:hypothetical protein